MVTRPEIVPGVYGRLRVWELTTDHNNDPVAPITFASRVGGHSMGASPAMLTAAELRAAAETLSQLADAMEQESKGVKQHVLKTIDVYWDAILEGKKTFEVRKNDRAFQTGDELILERWQHDKFGVLYPTVPRRMLKVRISYLLQGGQFGIEPAYCVLGFKGVRAIA